MQVRFPTVLIFLLFSLPCLAQAGSRQVPNVSSTDVNITDTDPERARIHSDMAKKANKDRVMALKNDTDKLLKLSIELKSYVDKSDENVLSLDVIKKADEIEKLAKSVKDKMKGPN